MIESICALDPKFRFTGNTDDDKSIKLAIRICARALRTDVIKYGETLMRYTKRISNKNLYPCKIHLLLFQGCYWLYKQDLSAGYSKPHEETAAKLIARLEQENRLLSKLSIVQCHTADYQSEMAKCEALQQELKNADENVNIQATRLKNTLGVSEQGLEDEHRQQEEVIIRLVNLIATTTDL